MDVQKILALQAGPELDRAVHQFVFGNVDRCGAYSTRGGDGFKLLGHLPLFVGRCDPAAPRYDPLRPFVAGRLTYERAVQGEVTGLRVTAATALVALCKAALIAVLDVPKAPAAPAMSSEEAARAAAARVGTARASDPRGRRTAQPKIGVHAKDARPPIPKRPSKFVGPNIPEE